MSPIPRGARGVFSIRAAFILAFAFGLAANLRADTLLYWNGSAPDGSASGTWNMNSANYTWSTNNDELTANDPNPQCYLKPTSPVIPVFANGSAVDGLPGPYTVTVDNSFGQIYITDMQCDVGTLMLTGGPLYWDSDSTDGPGYNLISVLSNQVFAINCVLANVWTSADQTAFHKYKTGTLVLGATNAWDKENVVIEGGTLMISVDQCFPPGTGLILGNGDDRPADGFVDTPATFNTGGHSQALSILMLTGPDDTIPRTIDFHNGRGTLSISNSSAISWATSNNASNSANPGPIFLTITNFSPAAALRFGNNNTGLTATQLSQIKFADYLNLPGIIDAHGFVTPALPVMQSVVVAGTSVQITWSAVPGRTYQLQYRNNISSPWQIFGYYSSDDDSITAYDTLTSVSRYYRVQVLP